jgi:YVTN family beta-propeller protein
MNRRTLFFLPAFAQSLMAQRTSPRLPSPQTDGTYLLPNGWKLSPAGRQVRLGGLPLRITRVPGQPYAVVTSNGYKDHFLAVVDLRNEKVVQRVPITEGWMGLAVSVDGRRVFASAGGEDRVLEYEFAQGKLEPRGHIQLESRTFPAGLALNPQGTRLYVVANASHALKIVDLQNRRVATAISVGVKPYGVAISADEKRAWVSNWGGDTLSVIDLPNSHPFATIRVHNKPNDVLLSRDGQRLFVANGNSNLISVVDTATNQVREEIEVALKPKSLPGTTPNALALSEKGGTLYVANADNNCVAVIDIATAGKSRSRGFIPTGWYPTAILDDADTRKLLVANGKGASSEENASKFVETPVNLNNPGYSAALLPGTLSFVDQPDDARLGEYSQQVFRNSPYHTPARHAAAPFPLGAKSPIQYVFYIIKENRTYDQIFGDMKEGNGDANYCLFPEKVTPNHHALARQFVLYDNLYHDAEVSADGHHWVTAAYATDYVEKLWPAMYGGKGRGARLDLHDDAASYPSSGFLWDLCARFKVSYRSYGEGARIRFAPPGYVRASTPSLEGHIHPTFYGADGIQQMSDRRRFELWIEEFRQFEKKGEMPRFTVMSLPGDHLLGTRPGAQTPHAMMAENDMVLGKIVDALTHSKFWPRLAIFVVEDDTQGGPDHVDVHRAPALVISPYTRRGFVDSTMYSSSSVVRTMELLLGLPPMTQYDAAAAPMWASFQPKPDLRPYAANPPGIDIDEKNPSTALGAARSLELTLEQADTSDDREYNEIIWKAVKGADAELPPRRVAAFVRARKSESEPRK